MSRNDVFSPLDQAILLAVQYHARTFDKGGAPYILHPLRVMLAMGADNAESQVLAVLHDIVEESHKHKRLGVSLESIRAQFDDRIADGLDAITRRATETYKEYILRCKENDLARWVKCEDLKDNLNKDRVPSYQHADFAKLWARYEWATDELISE